MPACYRVSASGASARELALYGWIQVARWRRRDFYGSFECRSVVITVMGVTLTRNDAIDWSTLLGDEGNDV